MLQVIGIGWRYENASTSDETAPVIQTMKIQLDVWDGSSPSWLETARWRGTAPNAYQTKAVIPAETAATFTSRGYRSSSGLTPTRRAISSHFQ